ncbi:hypothetical protein WJX72_004428 [[Myrmecia] bisecta]|uniref:Phosphoglycerate mutase n=1 Tax=[Myrmecia] bisecta TaxID=41462 RepID=A0AAW1Q109_9CHLO
MSLPTRAQRRELQDQQRAAKKLARMSSQATELLLVRHGETDWNLDNRLQGQSELDPPLNQTGLRQAQALVEGLRQYKIDAVYSSDLLRTMQTAQVLAAAFGKQVVPDPDLRERHLGVLQGLTHPQAAAAEPDAYIQLTANNPDTRLPGGGESVNDLAERAGRAISKIANQHPGQTVLVVVHGGLLHECYRHAAGHAYNGKMVNGAINRIKVDRNEWVVLQWGDVTHLKAVGYQKAAHGGSALSI